MIYGANERGVAMTGLSISKTTEEERRAYNPD
jgi:hypothetical protein